MGPEARVPCPVCGGPIHPVAGRCKHCKTDLAAARAGKPQAQTTLPSLGNRTSNDRPVAGPRMPARLGSGRGALPAMDPTLATFSMGSRVPSNNVHLSREPVPVPAGWPVVVIALSSLAIILAVGALAAQFR